MYELDKETPQALFFHPIDDQGLNLIEKYLPHLQKLEGDSIDEFIRRSKNSEAEFADQPGDDDSRKNELDTLKRLYSPQRFVFDKIY